MIQAFGCHSNVAFTSVTLNDLWYSTPFQPDFFFNKILGSLDVFLSVGEFLFQDIQVWSLYFGK